MSHYLAYAVQHGNPQPIKTGVNRTGNYRKPTYIECLACERGEGMGRSYFASQRGLEQHRAFVHG